MDLILFLLILLAPTALLAYLIRLAHQIRTNLDRVVAQVARKEN